MEYMEEWIAFLCCNPDYLTCLEKLRNLEAEYKKLYSSLSKSSQALLDRYISVCEEMDDLMCSAAYELGRKHGSQK